jgi:hypothetical protein
MDHNFEHIWSYCIGNLASYEGHPLQFIIPWPFTWIGAFHSWIQSSRFETLFKSYRLFYALRCVWEWFQWTCDLVIHLAFHIISPGFLEVRLSLFFQAMSTCIDGFAVPFCLSASSASRVNCRWSLECSCGSPKRCCKVVFQCAWSRAPDNSTFDNSIVRRWQTATKMWSDILHSVRVP